MRVGYSPEQLGSAESVQAGAHRCVLHRLIGGELRRGAIGVELVVELVCAGLDGHARAVEALGEQHPPPAQPVVCAREFQLRSACEHCQSILAAAD